MRQFNIVVYYKNQEKLDMYLSRLYLEKPLRVKNYYREHLTIYLYECFYIRCYNRFAIDYDRANKVDLIAIENCYKNEDNFTYMLNCILKPSIIGLDLSIQYFGN